jgi:hypothetical protein
MLFKEADNTGPGERFAPCDEHDGHTESSGFRDYLPDAPLFQLLLVVFGKRIRVTTPAGKVAFSGNAENEERGYLNTVDAAFFSDGCHAFLRTEYAERFYKKTWGGDADAKHS